jgi:hypothetical protein
MATKLPSPPRNKYATDVDVFPHLRHLDQSPTSDEVISPRRSPPKRNGAASPTQQPPATEVRVPVAWPVLPRFVFAKANECELETLAFALTGKADAGSLADLRQTLAEYQRVLREIAECKATDTPLAECAALFKQRERLHHVLLVNLGLSKD